MTSICLPNFVLLTLIWTILHVVRTILLHYKGGRRGVGEPRNNNVQPRPVGRAWIFLAGGRGELFATKKFNSPIWTKVWKPLGLPLVRGHNVLNNNFLIIVRRTIRKTLMETSCTFLRPAIIFIAIFSMSSTCIIFRLYCTVSRVKMNHGVGCRLSWQSTLYQYLVYMWPVSAVCLQPFF